jgi:hypothetical protein
LSSDKHPALENNNLQPNVVQGEARRTLGRSTRKPARLSACPALVTVFQACNRQPVIQRA